MNDHRDYTVLYVEGRLAPLLLITLKWTMMSLEECYHRRWVVSLLPAPPLSLGTLRFLVYLPARQKHTKKSFMSKHTKQVKNKNTVTHLEINVGLRNPTIRSRSQFQVTDPELFTEISTVCTEHNGFMSTVLAFIEKLSQFFRGK